MSGPNAFAKLICLTVCVLLLVVAVACVIYKSVVLAIPAAVISAYSFGLYFDFVQEEIIMALRDPAESDAEADSSSDVSPPMEL